jgi:hypothetical protein
MVTRAASFVQKKSKEVTMSNNKQTDIAELAMKEYPFSNSERNAFINGYNKAKELHKNQTIELPSDEEIEKESLKFDFDETFRVGAKWMRDKIQGQ